MKYKELLGIVNDPIIIYRNVNLGNISSLDMPTIKIINESPVLWLEGLPNKKIAVYIGD